jgi:hypothetical protein
LEKQVRGLIQNQGSHTGRWPLLPSKLPIYCHALFNSQ